MSAVSGYMGYPNQFQVYANPTGAGLNSLNAEYAKDFGLYTPPVYNLPYDVSMGYGMGGGAFGLAGMGMMNPYMGMNKQYLEYLNMDFKDRLQYDSDLRTQAAEIQYTESKTAKNYASATDGLTGSIREACNSLQTVVAEGETDQIVKQFDGIVDMLRRSPLYERLKQEFANDPIALEKTLRNCAREQYQAVTGQDLKAVIQQNCDSALTNSFWNTISFGNAQTYSAEEIIAKMEGTEPPRKVKTKQKIGQLGGATATTATGAAIGAIAGPVGALVGAGIGLVAGIIGANCA